MHLKYFLLILLVFPCLPFLLYQAKKVRKKIPKLPDAKDAVGVVEASSTKSLQLIVLGESTAAGVGVDKHKDGLPGHIALHLSAGLGATINWKVYGRSGFTAKRILRETVPEMEKEKVDLIAIALGGNDAFEMNTSWGWQRDTNQLIQALHIKYPSAKIAFMHMPPIKEFTAFTRGMKWALGSLVEIFGEVLAKEITSHQHAYFHHQIVSIKKWRKQAGQELNVQDFFSDGVHPSALNYQLWGKEFANWVIDKRILN